MIDKLNTLEQIFKDNKKDLPLIFHQVNIKENKIDSTGKCVQVLKYRTNLFPIDDFYKPVTRIIE